ncbi:MAG: Rne/Rng family ribonuclease [Solirubrobacterales bacterium]
MKKKILVSVDAGETRVAVLEAKGTARKGGAQAKDDKDDKDDKEKSESGGGRGRGGGRGGSGWRVGELYVERRGSRSIVGNIYKGVVDNVLPGMEAAFVDIGLERNGFLHVDEIVTPDGKAQPKRGHGKGRRIDELIKRGQEIVVQVVKDPLKTKGARLTMQVSIAGRYLVYMPQGAGIGVSRRMPDGERTQMRKSLEKLHKQNKEKGGYIVRTAAQGARQEDFEREIAYLHKLHEVLDRRSADVAAPSLVFQEADLPIRVLRDVLGSEFDGAEIDDEKQFQRVTSFFQRTAPELVSSVEMHSHSEHLFERYGAEAAFESTLSRRVDLPSGGYLIIDYAEALTVVDINTGSFTGKGKGRLEDTITKVNVEAADEVVRQLRLRDIGGIIVIDFIDMARAKNRDQVLKTLRKALDEDRTKTYVVEVSPLGLVEMTRQNVTDGVREILTERCPTCDGEGVVRSAETVAIDVLRRLRDVADSEKDAEAHLIRVNPKVARELMRHDSGLLELEEELKRTFLFEGGDALPIDTFEVAESGPRAEIERRALPFAVGDEVLLTIDEPHMYNPGDAVARVDALVITVGGAASLVGQRKLVRIDAIDRSSGEATLVDGPPSDNGADGDSPDSLESGTRRRGRRGGRRRSRAGSGSRTSTED